MKQQVQASQVLADRLSAGWVMCEQERDPRKRAELEDYWIKLLRRYEQACDAERQESRGAA